MIVGPCMRLPGASSSRTPALRRAVAVLAGLGLFAEGAFACEAARIVTGLALSTATRAVRGDTVPRPPLPGRGWLFDVAPGPDGDELVVVIDPRSRRAWIYKPAGPARPSSTWSGPIGVGGVSMDGCRPLQEPLTGK